MIHRHIRKCVCILLSWGSAAGAQSNRAPVRDDVAGVRYARVSQTPHVGFDMQRMVDPNGVRSLVPDSSRRVVRISTAAGAVAGAAIGGITGHTLARALYDAPRDRPSSVRSTLGGVVAGAAVGGLAGGLVGYLVGLLIVDRPQ